MCKIVQVYVRLLGTSAIKLNVPLISFYDQLDLHPTGLSNFFLMKTCMKLDNNTHCVILTSAMEMPGYGSATHSDTDGLRGCCGEVLVIQEVDDVLVVDHFTA